MELGKLSKLTAGAASFLSAHGNKAGSVAVFAASATAVLDNWRPGSLVNTKGKEEKSPFPFVVHVVVVVVVVAVVVIDVFISSNLKVRMPS